MIDHSSLLRTVQVTPGYWRATIDNPPLNLLGPELLGAFTALIDQLEADPQAKVVVFDSALPDYFMAHLDLLRQDYPTDVGPTGLPPWPDFTTRLRRAPFISVGVLRGRARGVGSEFLQALDVRFASLEHAVIGQPEIGFGIIPGGGGMETLWRHIGRARALEVITSGEDYDAETAERYGWINRAVPDAELDQFVERYARRVASFDKEALTSVKEIINAQASAPRPEELMSTYTRFNELLFRPTVQARNAELATRGLQTPGDLEYSLGEHIGPADQPKQP
ncbi:enoyl-CoA hydratase/isomerase family protein [Streptomyces sp.]|uniref:enoyl-CoA hydratase/isomerase family protein n=1 Tax=Streptomyces sp. TaxID=1931 RepID=UPI002F42BBAF